MAQLISSDKFILVRTHGSGAHVTTYSSRTELVTEMLLTSADGDVIEEVRALLDGEKQHYFVRRERKAGMKLVRARSCAICGRGRGAEQHYKEW